MGAARKTHKVLPIVASEMARLQFCSLSVLPLGAGPDGKSPLRTAANPALRVILGSMAGAGSQVYGIRLSGLTVLDADQPEYLSVIKERFGPAAVVVRTPRGFHAYYEGEAAPLFNPRREGWPVDVKSGGGLMLSVHDRSVQMAGCMSRCMADLG